MAYPQEQVPDTQHSVFYSHSIHVNGFEIASFERVSIRYSRTVERIREILFTRGPEVKELVWGGTDISIDISRVEMYNKAMFEAFGFEIFTLEDFNQPVNVTEMQFNPNDEGKRVITYLDCVPSDASKDIDINTARMVESLTFQVRTVRGRRVS